MSEITSQAFPQKAERVDAHRNRGSADLRGPNFFKWGENVRFQRVSTLDSLRAEGATLHLACAANAFPT